MLLLDIGIGCSFFAILVGGLSAFRDFALSLQFGSNLFFVWVASFVLEGSPSIKKICVLIYMLSLLYECVHLVNDIIKLSGIESSVLYSWV